MISGLPGEGWIRPAPCSLRLEERAPRAPPPNLRRNALDLLLAKTLWSRPQLTASLVLLRSRWISHLPAHLLRCRLPVFFSRLLSLIGTHPFPTQLGIFPTLILWMTTWMFAPPLLRNRRRLQQILGPTSKTSFLLLFTTQLKMSRPFTLVRYGL